MLVSLGKAGGGYLGKVSDKNRSFYRFFDLISGEHFLTFDLFEQSALINDNVVRVAGIGFIAVVDGEQMILRLLRCMDSKNLGSHLLRRK